MLILPTQLFIILLFSFYVHQTQLNPQKNKIKHTHARTHTYNFR